MILNFLRWLREHSDIEISIFVVEDGPLTPEFAEIGPTLVATGPSTQGVWERLVRRLGWATYNLLPMPSDRSGALWRVRKLARESVVRRLRRQLQELGPFDFAYLNSVHSAPVLQLLPADVRVLTHVHELKYQTDLLSPEERSAILARTERYVAASGAARAHLIEHLGVAEAEIDVSHEFIPIAAPPARSAVDAARAELGIPQDARVVGAVGAVGWIKGSDLLAPIAHRVLRQDSTGEVVFIWLGNARLSWLLDEHRYDIEQLGLRDQVRFVGARPDPRPYVGMFDIFVLPSRSDTYPLAALEAASLGKPIVCFDAGGMTEFLDPAERLVVPYLDIDAMAGRISELLSDDDERSRIGAALAARVRERHQLDVGASRLLATINAFARPAAGSQPVAASRVVNR